MTAATISVLSSPSASMDANRWIDTHHAELLSRANALFGHLPPEARDDAVAETMAMTTVAAHRAAQAGKLDQLTPYWLVVFAGRHYRQGRRVAGYSSSCVMSEACRVKHGLRLVPLSALDEDADDQAHISLRESLADRDAEDPFDIVRRDHDYPSILDKEGVSPKARATLRFLAETAGEGRQADLAGELCVSPARITQLKGELAGALGRNGYRGPMGPRPSASLMMA